MNGLELICERAPAADGRPPLLLVHGGAHAAWCWERWLPALAARGWTANALSLRGHGASGGTVRGATLGDYVDDIVWAAERLGEPPILIGHSMGGLLVELAAARTPVRAVVMVAPAPSGGLRHALRLAIKHPKTILALLAGRSVPFTRDQLLSGEVSTKDAERVMTRLDPESFVAQYQVLIAHRHPPAVSCPVLLLASPDDVLISPDEISRKAARHNADVRWFPGLGHDLMLEPRGEEVVTALIDWLTEQLPLLVCSASAGSSADSLC
ncbi:MAG: alpha/beta hydrolase [Solirubrobacteraceae bacterium]